MCVTTDSHFEIDEDRDVWMGWVVSGKRLSPGLDINTDSHTLLQLYFSLQSKEADVIFLSEANVN